jgi:C-terminal processing protease CtpA/Prc
MWRVCDRKNQVKEYRADRDCLFRQWPMAVLVNENIVDNGQGAFLAALQDNGRAVLVGEPTKNDGYVNTLIPLGEGQGVIQLRTGRLERAAKEKRWPVQPNHAVAMTAAQREAVSKWLRQKFLPELPEGTDDRPPEDPQLNRAVEVLRAALQVGVKADKR